MVLFQYVNNIAYRENKDGAKIIIGEVNCGFKTSSDEVQNVSQLLSVSSLETV